MTIETYHIILCIIDDIFLMQSITSNKYVVPITNDQVFKPQRQETSCLLEYVASILVRVCIMYVYMYVCVNVCMYVCMY